MRPNPFILTYLILFVFTSIQANNGEISIGQPVQNIILDGNLSDWPSSIRKYGIKRNQNRYPPEDTEDLSAYFQVGYNLEDQSLYIGVTVQDDSHIVDSDLRSTHLNQDAHLLYLDIQHSIKGSGVALFALTQNSLRLVNNHLSWDQQIKDLTINNITQGVARHNGITVYEWKIFLGEDLQLNSVIGMDHVIIDMDGDDLKGEYSTLAWGSNGWKSSMQNNLGDLIILQANPEYGSIKGTVGWNNNSISATPWGIQFISKDRSNFWTQLPLKGKPSFELNLPPGEYKIRMSLPSTADTSGQYAKVNQELPTSIHVQKNVVTEIGSLLFETIPLPSFKMPEGGYLIDGFQVSEADLDSFINEVMNYYNIPGLSMACVQGDSVLFTKNFGTSNNYTKAKVTDKTLFDIGSVTKTIFATAVLRLVEEGKFDLDKPLYKYVPYPDLNHDNRYKDLTGRHVLSHQSGLPNWRNGRLEFINAPGMEFGYSGEGFEYLKTVIESITNEDIETTLRRLVINPYEIEKAYFRSNPDLLENLSFGHYDLNLQIHAPENETFVAYGMHSNAKYFSNYLIGLLNNNILKQNTYRDMLTMQIKIPSDWPSESTGWEQGYGLGFQIKNSPYGLVFGHGGRNGGFDCNFEIYPDMDIGYVFFTNSSSGHLIKNLIRQFLIIGEKN